MLKTFRQLSAALLGNGNEEQKQTSTEELHLAAAALMLEVATVDQNLDEREVNAVLKRLQQHLQLPEKTTHTLLDLAKEQQSKATSLYQFTHLINEHFSEEEKYSLIVDMWSVAYADNDIDKYEEYIIRRVAELIYVPHADFIRAKITVRERQPAN